MSYLVILIRGNDITNQKKRTVKKKQKEVIDRNHKQLFNSDVKNSFVKIKVSLSEMVNVNPSQCFFH